MTNDSTTNTSTFGPSPERKPNRLSTGLALLDAAALHIGVVPDLKNEQRPEPFAVVLTLGELLVDEVSYIRIIKNSLLLDGLAAEARQHQIPELAVKPFREGNSEALFFPMDDISRQILFGDFFQNVFRREAAELVLYRHAANEIDNVAIQQRAAHLETVRHAGTVHRHEIIVLEIELHREVKNALQLFGETAPAHIPVNFLVSIFLLQFIADRGAQQLIAFAVVECTAPEEKPDLRRDADTAEELLQLEIETQIPMGNRQPKRDCLDKFLEETGQRIVNRDELMR